MNRRIYAVAVALSLVGCQGIPPSTEANAIGCMTSLLESGNFEPAVLASLATVTPSCQALAAAIVSDILARVTAQNARLARAQGRLR